MHTMANSAGFDSSPIDFNIARARGRLARAMLSRDDI
jgi:hypothetical protein